MAFIKNLPVSDGDDDSADHPYVKNLKRVKSQAEAKKQPFQRQNQTSSEVEGAIPLKPGSLTSLGMSQLNWPFENWDKSNWGRERVITFQKEYGTFDTMNNFF